LNFRNDNLKNVGLTPTAPVIVNLSLIIPYHQYQIRGKAVKLKKQSNSRR